MVGMIMDQYRVVPMRLFATWEGDRASSNCVPRLCTLTLNRLTIFKTLESDLNCLVIAVKLQGYKRTMRSNDLNVVPVNGIVDIDLDISFTLQYPHFIKKKDNCLMVMLQRRRRYKNRPIPGGFKTLACGIINLTEVLQSSTGIKELALHSDLYDDDANPGHHLRLHHHHPSQPLQQQTPVAKLYLQTLSSQPLEQDDSKVKEHPGGEFSDEDEEDSTANDDGGSDSEPAAIGDENAQPPLSARSKRGRNSVPSSTSRSNGGAGSSRFANRQKNFKQKFVALLKKFKISEEEVLKAVDSESQQPTEQEIRDLLEELDNYSNSDQELDADTISVKSTPKPSLRPYFSSAAASRERLPVIEHGGRDSEESKDSGDSQGDVDTTDPEQSDFAGPFNASSQSQAVPPIIIRAADSTPAASSAVSASASVPKIAYGKDALYATPKESKQSAFSRPTAGRSSDKKKKLSPGNRQISADASPASDHSKHQNVLERLHATTASGSRLRSSKDGQINAGFMFSNPLPHPPVTEQLAQILSADEMHAPAPEMMILVSAFDVHCQNLVQGLRDNVSQKLVVVSSQNDVKMVLNAILSRIQKFCNTNVFQAHNAVKLILIGADRFFAQCLKSFTELMAQKSNEWMHFIRFFILGPLWSVVVRCLSTFDHGYATIFGDNLWKEWWDKVDMNQQDITDVVNRVSKYVSSAKLMLQLPIAEAMLQLKDKKSNEESNIFVPFIVDVRRAAGENFGLSESSQMEIPVTSSGGQATSGTLSGSPPNTFGTNFPSPRTSSSGLHNEQVSTGLSASHISPPGSPHAIERSITSGPISSAGEAQDLQIEYWTAAGVQGSSQLSGSGTGGFSQKREQSITAASNAGAITSGTASGGLGLNLTSNLPPTKYSLKTAFKSLIITRLPQSPSSLLGDTPALPPSLFVQFIKEKKKDKVLQKLGMKNKEKIESEQKSQSIDGISRLICSTKQHATMKLNIDGVEWTNVKFFQISAQWQTHVKYMPIALFHIDI